MAGHTVPIDFWMDPNKLQSKAEQETLVQNFMPLIEPFFGSMNKVSEFFLPGGHKMLIYSSQDATLTFKIYKEGLVQTSLDYLVKSEDVNVHKILIDHGRDIEKQLLTKIGAIRSRVLPALKRAPPVNCYLTSSDDRMFEYDCKEILFDQNSKFQKVQIFRTTSFGNMLVLDGLQNLAESDIVPYTHALMNSQVENYEGKEVLILGGGDGSLLWELLKEKPAFVTMIDIDEMVIKACKIHMRSVCGDCMDKYDGANYKIIVDDAIAHMKEYIKKGKKFDYVFGDLTDTPISENSKYDQDWEFMQSILDLGVQILKPSGKYLMHTIAAQLETTLQIFESKLQKLILPVEFTKTTSYVPSFMENWCFYQISLKS